MNTVYITFGQNHIHDIGGGMILTKDHVAKITRSGDPMDEVRRLFGSKWSRDFPSPPSDEDMKWFYPGGIVTI